MRVHPTQTRARGRRWGRRGRYRRVLAACEETLRSSRDILRGISQYSREHGHWQFVQHPGARGQLQSLNTIAAAAEECDGIIARVADDDVLELVRRVGGRCALVTVMNRHDGSRVPVVTDDEEAIAATAYEHFHQAGLRRFAFVGQYYLETERSAAFASLVRRHGYGCECIAPDAIEGSWAERMRVLRRWLRRLQRPVGVLAFDAYVARNVAAACQDAQLRVPEDVAILTPGDELACEMAWPPISAIHMARQRMGWEAAALLDALLDGREPPQRKVVVNPQGVLQRQSTDVLAVPNDAVAQAVWYIRREVRHGAQPRDVLAAVNLSRSGLEKAFKQCLGRTIHQEITRVRIQLTQEMLATTELSLPEVAVRCGYTDRTRLSSIFRRETGMTPKAYRQQARLGRMAGV